MSESEIPRPYDQWRTDSFGRVEDAAYTFGYHLMQHCRAEALKRTEAGALPATGKEFEARVTTAVDTALHNVMDLLEGFWPAQAGPKHRVKYALSVCISDISGNSIERIDISPTLLDLPIGYWKFRQGEFR